jgi:hypothetical protein
MDEIKSGTMDNFQARVNRFFIDLSLYWRQLTTAEKEILSGLAGTPGQPLAEIINAIRHGFGGFETQFLPVAEAILQRGATRVAEKLIRDAELEDLQKDYCVLAEINQRMEKQLDRLENKKAKRQAKQKRVKRYFTMRGRKAWEINTCRKLKNTTPLHIRLTQPLAASRKRLVKGTLAYDEEKEKLDAELDKYQNAPPSHASCFKVSESLCSVSK